MLTWQGTDDDGNFEISRADAAVLAMSGLCGLDPDRIPACAAVGAAAAEVQAAYDRGYDEGFDSGLDASTPPPPPVTNPPSPRYTLPPDPPPGTDPPEDRLTISMGTSGTFKASQGPVAVLKENADECSCPWATGCQWSAELSGVRRWHIGGGYTDGQHLATVSLGTRVNTDDAQGRTVLTFAPDDRPEGEGGTFIIDYWLRCHNGDRLAGRITYEYELGEPPGPGR